MASVDIAKLNHFAAISVILLAGTLLPAGSIYPQQAAANDYMLAVTEIEKGRGGHFYVKAYIEDEPVDVLVDTGASAVALTHEDAESIGINTRNLEYDHPVQTANGLTHYAKVTLRRVEIDNITLRQVEAAVMPEGALSITLLGMSFLGRLDSFKIEDGVLVLED